MVKVHLEKPTSYKILELWKELREEDESSGMHFFFTSDLYNSEVEIEFSKTNRFLQSDIQLLNCTIWYLKFKKKKCLDWSSQYIIKDISGFSKLYRGAGREMEVQGKFAKKNMLGQ